MTSTFRVRATLTGAALVLAGLLAACSAPKPPPPPPPPPAVSLSPRLIEQASAYRTYMQRATAISPAFADGAAIAQSLKVGAAYEPGQLLRGAVAYGAVAALQDPAFVAGVRTYSTDPTLRQTVTAQIIRDPAYVALLPGASGGAGLVMAALGEEGRKLWVSGRAVKQAAYDVQHSPWSKASVENRPARLSEAKMLSATPGLGEMAETARLQQAALGAAPLGLTGAPASAPYTPLVIRSMAVAALAVLGQAGDENLDKVMAVAAEPGAASCLNMSKLNLYQCLAVSVPHYEDVFCLGQHIMMDTGKCLMKGAGMPEPIDVKTTPLTIAAADAPAKASATAVAAAPTTRKR